MATNAIADLVDGLLAGIDEQAQEKTAGQVPDPEPPADVGELEKLAGFCEEIADQMETAVKEGVGEEALIPPDQAAVGEGIQGVTGIDRSEAARQQATAPKAVMQQALLQQAAQQQAAPQQPKTAESPEEIRQALPKPSPATDPAVGSACKSAESVLRGVLTGSWPAPFVKRLAE